MQKFEDTIIEKINEIKTSKNPEKVLIALHSFLSDNLDSPAVIIENIKSFEQLHHELYNLSLEQIRLERLKLINKYIDTQYLFSLPINKIHKALETLNSFLDFNIFYDVRRADFFAPCLVVSSFKDLDFPDKFKSILEDREKSASKLKEKVLNVTKNTNKYNWNTLYYEAVISKSLIYWQKNYGDCNVYVLDDTEKRMNSLIIK